MEHTDTERLNWLIDLDNNDEAERLICTEPPETFRETLDKLMENTQ